MHGKYYASTLQYLIVDFPVSESFAANALYATSLTKLFYFTFNCPFCYVQSFCHFSHCYFGIIYEQLQNPTRYTDIQTDI